MQPVYKIIAGLATLAFLQGCYFTSQQPLTAQPVPGADPALLGLWQAVPEKAKQSEAGEFMLFVEETDGHILVMMIEDGYRFSEMYRGHISKVGDLQYLNVKSLKPSLAGDGHSVPDYYIVAYQIGKDQLLNIYMLNEDVIRKAITAGEISGKITKGRYTDEIVLSATSEELAKLFSSQNQKLLAETTKLVTARKVERFSRPGETK